MPSKKKKYNSRFPPARIKKIMQTDDEIGKVAAAVPVLISKCLEMFLVSILQHTGEVTKGKHAKTMSTSHLKECINNVGMFDFLKDVVANVADMQNEEEPGTSSSGLPEEAKKTARKRNSTNPKTPKKRARLGESRKNSTKEELAPTASEDEDSCAETSQDSSNGLLSSSLSSTGHGSPKQMMKPSQVIERPRDGKTSDSMSFHIPLTNLISADGTEVSPKKNLGKETTSSEVKKKLLKKIDSNLDGNKPKTTEADLDGAEAIDMTIKPPVAHTTRCPVIVTNCAVIAQQKSTVTPALTVPNYKVSNTLLRADSNGSHPALPQQSPAIPSPLNMSHLYRPTPAGVPTHPGSAKHGSEHSMPEGGMLSFLYSPYTGDAHSPVVLPPRPAGEHLGQPQTKDINLHKSGVLSPPFQYPYNPVSAQREHNPPGTMSHFPPASQTQNIASKLHEDDDYDV
uniref:Dr1-associated corepressor n=1 Tax=Phallusia mammillata TaxID=59560 RepID=A0A6F9DJ83_9ASCI|nr:uncharacterized protein LOC100186645 [Phallusia mammillata]